MSGNGADNGDKVSKWLSGLRLTTPAGVVALVALVLQISGTLDGIKQQSKQNGSDIRTVACALYHEHAHDQFHLLFQRPRRCPK